MEQRIIAFDVETPNYRNDRMSAIGLCEIQDGEITRKFYTLVDPEEEFDPFNISLTGITPEMVRGKPTFDVLWRLLEPLFQGNLLVAHNAPFDMSVLGKCLRDYGIVWKSQVEYACSCQMSRRILPELPNHKLNTVSDYLGLSLDHHHAGSDAQACGEIFLACMKRGARLSSFRRRYDLQRLCTCR